MHAGRESRRFFSPARSRGSHPAASRAPSNRQAWRDSLGDQENNRRPGSLNLVLIRAAVTGSSSRLTRRVQPHRESGLQESPVMGPWNRHSVLPRHVDRLIDAFRVACGLGVAVVGGYHLAAGIIGGAISWAFPPMTSSWLRSRQAACYLWVCRSC
jgi:hypothetical protein